MELCSIKKCACCRIYNYKSVLCNINAESITLHEALHDSSLNMGLQANIHVWLSHGTISIIGSLVVKGLIN